MGTLSDLLQLLSLACLVLSNVIAFEYHVMIVPQSPVVEIGKNFTATCLLINTNAATADDLVWSFPKPLPKEQYTKINDSAINITVTITSEMPEWLMCKCKSSSPDVIMNESKFMHGILLRKGYPPEKPENLSCVAVQSGDKISNVLSCTWEPGKRESRELQTNYTLFARVTPTTENDPVSVVVKQNNSGQISLPHIFPHHMDLEIWVEAENGLGKVHSEHLEADANQFVKTNPPSNMKVISEENFTTSLLLSWKPPLVQAYVSLIYHIRFCIAGSGTWTEVPLEDTASYIQSFRLQYFKPDTDYDIQVRCKDYSEDNVYWSDWSSNATARTPEDVPKSKPDLWRIVTPTEGGKRRTVQVICKDPLVSNGKIRSFDIRIRAGEWESIPVNGSESDPRRITALRQIDLADREMAYIEVVARNSVGKSPKASIVIPKTRYERQPVGEFQWSSQGGQLCLEWQPPNFTAGGDHHRDNVTEYVVEWVSLSDSQMDWQRERANTTRTAIRGTLERFKRYNVSVYPLYSGWTGKPVTTAAYLEQGVPLEGPSVRLEGKPGRNEAALVWKEIPLHKRRGFITNYTIFYSAEGKEFGIPVSSDTHSYALKPLSSNTKYVAWIMASTIRGSINGTEHSFSTSKYAPGQIEGIVVGVCLGFLFLLMLTMFLCIYKKDSIKKNFWPQIPNPGNSSIGAWSPDFPSKPDTPKENAMADVSVVEVDVFDGKSVFEDDKACLPLKKDKYLSEEHSSGIGGSSCMSSPRQSVSDSDEGGDSGQTTGSTVQYSSVVASNGYKGQTPSSLPQPQQHTFARSESTQPLLDSEENPDAPLGLEGGGQSHRLPRKPYFRRSPGNEDAADSTELSQLESEEQGGLVSLGFCPLEEGSQQTTPTEEGQSPDSQPAAPVSSYRPQLSGYRPQ